MNLARHSSGEEARAEAKILMRVQEHILTPRYGGAVIGGIHDHISGAYLLSRPGTQLIKAIQRIGNARKHRITPETLPEVVKDANGADGAYFQGDKI